MRKFLISAALLLAASAAISASPAPSSPAPQPAAASPAPSAAHLALARRYVALVRPSGTAIEDMRSGIMAGAMGSVGDGASDQQVAATRKQVEVVVARFEPVLRKRLPVIDEAYAAAYARNFTAAELQDLIAFASSPAGRKYHASIDMVDYDDAVVEAEEARDQELAPILEDLRKTACAEAAAKRVAMGDTKAKCALSGEGETRSL